MTKVESFQQAAKPRAAIRPSRGGLQAADLIGFFRRQYLTVALTAATILALALLVAFQLTPLYTATALLRVDPRAERFLQTDRVSLELPNTAGMVESEIEIITSDSLLQRVANELHLAEDPEFASRPSLLSTLPGASFLFGSKVGDRSKESAAVASARLTSELRDKISVGRRGITSIIEVNVESASPEKAATIANALGQAYISLQVEEKQQAAQTAAEVLSARLGEIGENLQASERELDAYLAQNIQRIEELSDASAEPIYEELASLRQERRAAQERLKRFQLISTDAQSLPSEVAGLPRAMTDLFRARAEAQSSLLRAPEEGRTLRAQIARIDSSLSVEAGRQTKRVEAELESIEERISETLGRLQGILTLSAQPNEMAANIARLRHSIEVNRSLYQSSLERLAQVQIEAEGGFQVPDSRMASQALVPFKKSFPPMVLIGFVALLMGSAAGMALATAREYFVTGFVDADSLEAALGVPVVATIPAGHGATRLQDEIVEAPFSVFSESVRRWKLSIDFLRKRESTCILITSSVKGEGKTTLALALARAYAVAGIDTVLVDADLRNPSVGRYIGVKAATGGLGRILTSPNSATTVQEALVKDPISSLRLLLGGGGGDEPGERLVSPEAWMRMILDVRKESSIIIIDSPPILPVIDAAVIARFVDVVSFVVKFASTPEAAAREGVRGISVSGGPEITAVLNGNRRSPDGTPATYTSYDAY